MSGPADGTDGLAAAEGAAEEGAQEGGAGDSASVGDDAAASQVGSARAPLASALAGGPTSFVNRDVALDSEPVIGSFTVDGLTFAVADDGSVALVGASADAPDLVLPESVSYEGIDYELAAIAPYAFYLSGATSVELPASVADVDERAFRSSSVERVEVDAASQSYASFDGALYSADMTRILLVPEGRSGQLRIPSRAASLSPEAFSHCASLEGFVVEAGCPAFSSGDGVLYDAAGATLLRVAPGAVDITIREGCTTIAAGAMEGCARLASIAAPASVASISPYLFERQPEAVMAPVAVAAVKEDAEGEGDLADGGELGEPDPADAQLTALVALTSTDDDLPEVDPSGITVTLPEGADAACWEAVGCAVEKGPSMQAPEASLDSAAVVNATPLGIISMNPNGGSIFIAGGAWGNGANIASVYSYFYGNLAFTGGVLQFAWFDENDRYISAKATKTGYTLTGWTGTANLPASAYPSTSQVVNWSSGTISETAQWRANTYTISFSANGGAGTVPASIAATYDQSYSVTAPSLTRAGYTFDGWATSAAGVKAYEKSGPFKNLTAADKGAVTLYAHWSANPYTIAFDSQGGSTVAPVAATYDANVTLPTPAFRDGYVFRGWDTKEDGTGSRYQAGVTLTKPNLATSGTVTLYAQWEPTISADIPLDVTARVDLLDVEEQEEATGYIESRCGEPLGVAAIELSPLSGASELFGAANVADVSLEVLAAGSASPDATFTLGAFASKAPATPAAFRMASYGSRVPISYRFDIPDELLPTLVETTKPVCSVAYTVALAS